MNITILRASHTRHIWNNTLNMLYKWTKRFNQSFLSIHNVVILQSFFLYRTYIMYIQLMTMRDYIIWLLIIVIKIWNCTRIVQIVKKKKNFYSKKCSYTHFGYQVYKVPYTVYLISLTNCTTFFVPFSWFL